MYSICLYFMCGFKSCPMGKIKTEGPCTFSVLQYYCAEQSTRQDYYSRTSGTSLQLTGCNSASHAKVPGSIPGTERLITQSSSVKIGNAAVE